MSGRPDEVVGRLVEEGADPDEILRATVTLLGQEPGVSWAGIAFREKGQLVVGPSAGTPDESKRSRTGIVFNGAEIGELWVDGEVDSALLDRLAGLIAAHVLIGWDTGGEIWEP